MFTFTQAQLEAWPVKEIRSICSVNGLLSSGNKKDLIHRILQKQNSTTNEQVPFENNNQSTEVNTNTTTHSQSNQNSKEAMLDALLDMVQNRLQNNSVAITSTQQIKEHRNNQVEDYIQSQVEQNALSSEKSASRILDDLKLG